MRSGATDASITNRIREIQERISGMKDAMEDIDTLVKKIQSEKASKLICPGNSGHHEKIKTKNHRNRGEGRF